MPIEIKEIELSRRLIDSFRRDKSARKELQTQRQNRTTDRKRNEQSSSTPGATKA